MVKTLSSLPRGIRNNNPGNLNFVGQKGAHKEPGVRGRFAVFNTPEEGIKALRDQLLLYYTRDHIKTVAGIIAKWAPPSDGNNTTAYAHTVASQLGLGVDTPLTTLTPQRLEALINAIIMVENGQNPYAHFVQKTVLTTAC